ncbi:MAG TPA: MOSC N-terminal beta barrel domain-containing protein [Solirubrobacteraceae bacterium]|nr:MOSC N-terminal beta barrel domain-containing protein [Solirubrobacteraceae bacterium]
MTITVTALRTTPIKALRIRAVDSIELGPSGASGDRAFYLIDEDGAMVNGKRLGALQTVTAEYDPADGVLALCFAEGERAQAPVRLGPEIDTTFFGFERRARLLDGPWAQALSRHVGRELRLVADGSAVDRGAEGAISLISRGSLERLAQAAAPGRELSPTHPEPVDARRFRMLIEIDGVEPHGEDRWLGRELEVGAARLRIHGNVGRCVTTTRGPESGDVDLPTLQMLATYRLHMQTTEPLPFGIHGEVLVGGTVRVGDELVVDPPARA